ncbi:MAG: 50S ribosomal protein L15e [Nanoarchaeota archaeon]
MGYQKYVQALYKKPKVGLGGLWKERLIQLRREQTVNRIEHPTRIDKARQYGYKAKKGFSIVRVKVNRGGKLRPRFMSGRKPVNYRRKFVLKKNHQIIAEEKAARKCRNCEVLGSYWVSKDGLYIWYEIVLADREKVSTYKGYEWVGRTVGKAHRGITSAGRKYRGLRHKGKGTEKIRPSLRANKGRGN